MRGKGWSAPGTKRTTASYRGRGVHGAIPLKRTSTKSPEELEMTDFTEFATVEADVTVWSADVPEGDIYWGMSALSDMDGEDLNLGGMVRAPGMSGWFEIVAIMPEKRAIQVESHDGALYDVKASEVSVN